jgi:hypothetical protein
MSDPHVRCLFSFVRVRPMGVGQKGVQKGVQKGCRTFLLNGATNVLHYL